jgi:hypothetical protein
VSTTYRPTSDAPSIAHTGACRPPAEWDASEISWPIPAAPVISEPIAGPLKRRRDEFHGDEAPGAIDYPVPSQKRVRDDKANGIPAARSVARTRHKAVAWIPKTKVKMESKETGRGAERLAAPNSQGLPYRPLPGPNFQQGWVVEAADKRLDCVEGSVEEGGAVHHNGSMVQQQQQGEEEGANHKHKHLEIMKILKPEHRALLADTQDDGTPGKIPEMRCRLCPNSRFKSWSEYKRHCTTSEAHPFNIFFCDNCGTYFARADLLSCHRRLPPPQCVAAKSEPEKVKEKRIETERAHEVFKEGLRNFLRTGEGIWIPFSQIMKEKYPDSVKKRTRGSGVVPKNATNQGYLFHTYRLDDLRV